MHSDINEEPPIILWVKYRGKNTNVNRQLQANNWELLLTYKHGTFRPPFSLRNLPWTFQAEPVRCVAIDGRILFYCSFLCHASQMLCFFVTWWHDTPPAKRWQLAQLCYSLRCDGLGPNPPPLRSACTFIFWVLSSLPGCSWFSTNSDTDDDLSYCSGHPWPLTGVSGLEKSSFLDFIHPSQMYV